MHWAVADEYDVTRYINQETGHRSDVPHNYIYNRQLDNLQILTGYHVKRVIIECAPQCPHCLCTWPRLMEPCTIRTGMATQSGSNTCQTRASAQAKTNRCA